MSSVTCFGGRWLLCHGVPVSAVGGPDHQLSALVEALVTLTMYEATSCDMLHRFTHGELHSECNIEQGMDSALLLRRAQVATCSHTRRLGPHDHEHVCTQNMYTCKLCALQVAKPALLQCAAAAQEAEKHERMVLAEHALQVAEQVPAAADMPGRQNAQLAATQRAAATAQTATQISKMVAAVMEPLREQVRRLPDVNYALSSLWGCCPADWASCLAQAAVLLVSLCPPGGDQCTAVRLSGMCQSLCPSPTSAPGPGQRGGACWCWCLCNHPWQLPSMSGSAGGEPDKQAGRSRAQPRQKLRGSPYGCTAAGGGPGDGWTAPFNAHASVCRKPSLQRFGLALLSSTESTGSGSR